MERSVKNGYKNPPASGTLPFGTYKFVLDEKDWIESVHAVRHGVGRVFAVKFLRLVLHEQRVAALMERGEDIGDEIVLIIMRRDAHVPGAEVCGERMLGRHEDERVLL